MNFARTVGLIIAPWATDNENLHQGVSGMARRDKSTQ